jgi:hypothetical protein
VDKLEQKLSGMEDRDPAAVRIILTPHLIAGRTGEDDLARALGGNSFEIMGDEFLCLFTQSGSQHGKPATPFILAQESEVYFCRLKNIDQRHWYLLGHWIKGCYTSREVNCVSFFFAEAFCGRIVTFFHPFCPLFVILSEDVMTFCKVFTDGVDLFRIVTRMVEVLSHVQPELFQMNPGRANFLAITTQSASENGLTEIHPFRGSQLLFAEQSAPKGCSRSEDIFQLGKPVNSGKLSLTGGFHSRTHLGANPAIRASL